MLANNLACQVCGNFIVALLNIEMNIEPRQKQKFPGTNLFISDIVIIGEEVKSPLGPA